MLGYCWGCSMWRRWHTLITSQHSPQNILFYWYFLLCMITCPFLVVSGRNFRGSLWELDWSVLGRHSSVVIVGSSSALMGARQEIRWFFGASWNAFRANICWAWWIGSRLLLRCLEVSDMVIQPVVKERGHLLILLRVFHRGSIFLKSWELPRIFPLLPQAD